MPSDAPSAGRAGPADLADIERCADRGDAATARTLAPRVAERLADQPECIARLCQILAELGAAEVAEAVIAPVIARFPDNLWLAVRHATIADWRNDTQASLARWSRVLRCWPEQAIGGVGLAGARLRHGDLGGAEQLYRMVARQFPDEVWAADGLASLASLRRDWPAAVALWRDVCARFPTHRRAGENLADAEEHLRRQTDYPAPIAAENAGNYVDAARLWEGVIAAFPDRPEPVLALAAVNTVLGRPRHRVTFLRDAIARFPENMAIRRALLAAAEADGNATLTLETLDWLCAHGPTPDCANALRRLLDTAASFADFRRTLRLGLATPSDDIRRALTGFLAETAARWPRRGDWTRRVGASVDSEPRCDRAACETLSKQSPSARAPRLVPLATPIDDPEETLLEASRREAIAILAHVNPFVLDRRIRRYQADILTTGTISFGDLFTAAAPAFAGCLSYAVPKSFAYRYVGDGLAFWLVTGEAADGYRIVALYDEASAAMLYDPSSIAGDPLELLGPRMRDITAAIASGLGPQGADRKIILVSGYDNYAHYMWNELPALLDIAGWQVPRIDEIAVVFEPFGPFDEIVRWPKSPPARLTSQAELRRAGNFHTDLLFTPGAVVVTPATRQLLGDVCARHAQGKFPEPRGAFTLWISLRRMYRRAVNLHELLQRVLERIERDGFACDVILDGFSTPFDIDTPHRHDAAYFRRHHAMAAEDAKALLDTVGTKFPKIRLLDATGADLPTAVTLASRADFYVCHHGTQQHKIGWTGDIPGIIHGNETISGQDSIARWVQLQCDSPIQPTYVPAAFIRDTATENERQDLPAFRDYAFVRLDECADFVFARVRATFDEWRAASVTRPRRRAAPKGSRRGRSGPGS